MASMTYPDFSTVKEVQKVYGLIADVTTATNYNRTVYIPIGNFHLLLENVYDDQFFSCDKLKELEDYMQMKYQQNANKVSPDTHVLSHYTDLFRRNRNLPFGHSPDVF